MKKRLSSIILVSILFALVLTNVASASSEYAWPTENHTLSRTYTQHGNKAIDIAVPSGTNVYASRGGTIYAVYYGCTNHSGISGVNCKSRGGCSPNTGYFKDGFCNNDFGNGVIIQHSDGTYAHYGHMTTTTVERGQYVKQGDLIGTSGDSGYCSGPCLHFELRMAGTTAWAGAPFNPVDAINNNSGSDSSSDSDKISCSVNTNDASSVTKTDAYISGSFCSTGRINVTESGVYLGESTSALHKIASDSMNYNTSYFNMWYTLSKNGTILSAGKTYYYQCYAVANGNTVWGPLKSFTTIAEPVISNKISINATGATNVGQTDAQLNGTCAYSGTRPTAVGIYFGSTSSSMNKIASDTINHTKNPFDIWYTLSKYGVTLNAGTTYYYKLYAIVNGSETQSNLVSFTTAAATATEPTYTAYVTGTNGSYLAINDAPAASPNYSNQIGRIPPGGYVTVYTNKTSGNWLYVSYNGVSGYAYGKYLAAA